MNSLYHDIQEIRNRIETTLCLSASDVAKIVSDVTGFNPSDDEEPFNAVVDKLCDEYGIEKVNRNEYEHPLMQSEETYKVSNVLTGISEV